MLIYFFIYLSPYTIATSTPRLLVRATITWYHLQMNSSLAKS